MIIGVSARDAARQFEATQAAFERARASMPADVAESFYMFAGRAARVRIVGRELAAQIVQPLVHMRVDAGTTVTPELTIDIWDENGGCGRPAFASRHTDAAPKLTAISADGRFLWQRRPTSLSFYDREARHIVGSVAWGSGLSVYERGKPLDRPLLEWHNDHDTQLIHAGLVSRDGAGVLFAGKSGSGKSTSVVSCLCAGFGFVSEDFVALQALPDGSFVGHSIYNSVFLNRAHLERFPCLRPYVMTGMAHEQKAFVILSQVFPDRLERAAPIRAVLLPRVVDADEASFRCASKGEALLALGPSSFLQIPNRRVGVRALDRMAQLVARVPCYWLDLGRDLGSIPRVVGSLIAELDRGESHG
jgi:hypothetical protein